MARVNKAHAATVNRLVRRYDGVVSLDSDVDVETSFARIEVETEATVVKAVRRLTRLGGPCYVAVTNREALPTALKAIRGTPIGLMDPQGDIIAPSAVEHWEEVAARA